MRRIFIASLFLFLASSCKQSDPPAIAFYYWKTTFTLTPKEKAAIEDNKTSTLYLRYFDVSLIKGSPFPIRPIVFSEPPPEVTIIPVVYIRNEVMLNPALDVKALAENIYLYIDQINTKNGITATEIQLDCDWSLRSKDNYFEFIKALKAASKKTLSATIRLHQVKYFKSTGVPEVDYGVLMYYNMGHISADSSNSIYDRATAKAYLPALKSYPLRLDVAVPLFSWGVHSRGGKVIELLNQWDETSVADSSNFTMLNKRAYVAKDNIITRGYFFQKGDVVKIESVQSDDVLEMASDIAAHSAQRPRQVIFYDLDERQLSKYDDEKEFFEEVSDAF